MASICFLKLSPTTPKTLTPNLLRPHFPSPPSLRRLSPKTTQTRMSYNSNNNNNNRTTTPASDRLISAISYALPFFNSLQYGRFLFVQYPKLGLVFDPLIPIVSLYRSIPYGSFVAFFGIYLGVVRNPGLSRYARFNAMQAITLDVLLVLPVLLQKIIEPGPTGFGFQFTALLHTAVFVFSVICFLYGLGSSLLGKTPYLPFVADAKKHITFMSLGIASPFFHRQSLEDFFFKYVIKIGDMQR